MILGFEGMGAFGFVLSALAAWRVTTLLCYDTGPFNSMTALRRLFYRTGLKALVDCFHCTAFWVSAALVLAIYAPHRTSLLLVISLAAAVSLVQKVVERAGIEMEE